MTRALRAPLLSAALVLIVAGAACRKHGRGAHKAMLTNPLPGAPKYDDALAAKLGAALEAKGSSYVPRTHHRWASSRSTRTA
jgi:hypothetical protein